MKKTGNARYSFEEHMKKARNIKTGEVGVVVTEHEVYPYKGDVTVKTTGGAQLWCEGDYEFTEEGEPNTS